MDDIVTKRETRRRKILDNSEQRLLKISRCKLEETNDSYSSDDRHQASLRIVNDIRAELDDNSSLKSASFSHDDNVSEAVGASQLDPNQTKSNSQKGIVKNVDVGVWKKLGFKLAVLAFIVRTIHIFKLGYLFGETIVIPFALFMLTQLGSCQFDQNVAGITGPILFFLGVPSNKIKNLLICYNVISTILIYFCIYFFTFVVAHLLYVALLNL